MPIIYQYRIYRQDLRNNPDVLYLFGDNLERAGYGGQAKEMRDEPNAIGIATKRRPTMDKNAFFYDDTLEENKELLRQEFHDVVVALDKGKIVVVPSDGLGTGLSMLPETAPLTFSYLESIIQKLELTYET